MNKFDLMSLLKLAIKNAFLLLLTGIVFATAVFCYCKFVAIPKYSSTGSLLVTNGAILTETTIDDGTSTLDNTDIVASMNLVGTISDILNTKGIYMDMADELDGRYSYQQLLSMVKVERKSDRSLFINISFTANDPKDAVLLVNEFLMIAPTYINEFVPNSEVAVSTADNSSKVFPQTTTYMAIASVVGIALVYALLILIESTNTIIQGEEDFENHFNVEVLASIPDFESSRNNKYKDRYSYGYGYGYGYSKRGGGK